MKKSILTLILLITSMVILTPNANAQRESGESVITVDAGFSVVAGLIKAVFNGETITDSAQTGSFTGKVSGGPAIVFGYDYGLSERWSIGALVSTQGFNGNANWTYIENNKLVRDEFDFTLRRSNFSISPKIHYGSDKVDLYTGLRVGYLLWTSKINSADPNFDELDEFAKGGRPTIGLTAIGGRIYATDELAVHFELNLGAPNILGLGLSYTL